MKEIDSRFKAAVLTECKKLGFIAKIGQGCGMICHHKEVSCQQHLHGFDPCTMAIDANKSN